MAGPFLEVVPTVAARSDSTRTVTGVRMVDGVDGVRLACHEDGPPDAPPMVLLHALGDSAADWAPVLAAFTAGHRVYAFDLRGHGASDRPGDYSFELMRDDVLAVFDALELDDVTVVGHSMGAVVAYLCAIAAPDRIARLVAEDAVVPFPRERRVPQRPAGELGFDWAVVPVMAAAVNDPARRWWPQLRTISAPALVIGGGERSTVPQHLLAEAVDLIPDATLVTIDVGHEVHADAPQEFSATVLQWLAAKASSAPGRL